MVELRGKGERTVVEARRKSRTVRCEMSVKKEKTKTSFRALLKIVCTLDERLWVISLDS